MWLENSSPAFPDWASTVAFCSVNNPTYQSVLAWFSFSVAQGFSGFPVARSQQRTRGQVSLACWKCNGQFPINWRIISICTADDILDSWAGSGPVQLVPPSTPSCRDQHSVREVFFMGFIWGDGNSFSGHTLAWCCNSISSCAGERNYLELGDNVPLCHHTYRRNPQMPPHNMQQMLDRSHQALHVCISCISSMHDLALVQFLCILKFVAILSRHSWTIFSMSALRG